MSLHRACDFFFETALGVRMYHLIFTGDAMNVKDIVQRTA